VSLEKVDVTLIVLEETLVLDLISKIAQLVTMSIIQYKSKSIFMISTYKTISHVDKLSKTMNLYMTERTAF